MTYLEIAKEFGVSRAKMVARHYGITLEDLSALYGHPLEDILEAFACTDENIRKIEKMAFRRLKKKRLLKWMYEECTCLDEMRKSWDDNIY